MKAIKGLRNTTPCAQGVSARRTGATSFIFIEQKARWLWGGKENPKIVFKLYCYSVI
jgi:hypothetical protein